MWLVKFAKGRKEVRPFSNLDFFFFFINSTISHKLKYTTPHVSKCEIEETKFIVEVLLT